MTKPLLEIEGGPGQRWGLAIDEGLVVALEYIRRPLIDLNGKEGFEMVWAPTQRLPAKLIEYLPVFIGQHQPWLRPVGMPVSQQEYARIRQNERNRVKVGEQKPALTVIADQAEAEGKADAAREIAARIANEPAAGDAGAAAE